VATYFSDLVAVNDARRDGRRCPTDPNTKEGPVNRTDVKEEPE
jgi:hypothetical protein